MYPFPDGSNLAAITVPPAAVSNTTNNDTPDEPDFGDLADGIHHGGINDIDGISIKAGITSIETFLEAWASDDVRKTLVAINILAHYGQQCKEGDDVETFGIYADLFRSKEILENMVQALFINELDPMHKIYLAEGLVVLYRNIAPPFEQLFETVVLGSFESTEFECLWSPLKPKANMVGFIEFLTLLLPGISFDNSSLNYRRICFKYLNFIVELFGKLVDTDWFNYDIHSILRKMEDYELEHFGDNILNKGVSWLRSFIDPSLSPGEEPSEEREIVSIEEKLEKFTSLTKDIMALPKNEYSLELLCHIYPIFKFMDHLIDEGDLHKQNPNDSPQFDSQLICCQSLKNLVEKLAWAKRLHYMRATAMADSEKVKSLQDITVFAPATLLAVYMQLDSQQKLIDALFQRMNSLPDTLMVNGIIDPVQYQNIRTTIDKATVTRDIVSAPGTMLAVLTQLETQPKTIESLAQYVKAIEKAVTDHVVDDQDSAAVGATTIEEVQPAAPETMIDLSRELGQQQVMIENLSQRIDMLVMQAAEQKRPIDYNKNPRKHLREARFFKPNDESDADNQEKQEKRSEKRARNSYQQRIP